MSLETSNTFFQGTLTLLLLINFAQIPFHHWNSAPENYHVSLDSVSMWKQCLHIPRAHSFITPEWLEPGCRAVSSLLEEREDSAEEGRGVPAVSPTKALRVSVGEHRAPHRHNLSLKGLWQAPVLHSPGTWAHSITAYDSSTTNCCVLSSHMFHWNHPIGGVIHEV